MSPAGPFSVSVKCLQSNIREEVREQDCAGLAPGLVLPARDVSLLCEVSRTVAVADVSVTR